MQPNYKKLSDILKSLENDFNVSLKDFEEDKIFQSKGNNIYLKKDKDSLYAKWSDVRLVFINLKSIIISHGKAYYFGDSYNDFIIKRYSVILYYNLVIRLQETFRDHEDFIRQYLDENYRENYSTIARFIYRGDFLYYLNYPVQFVNLMISNIDKDLLWMIDEKIDYKFKLDFDYKNIYYHIKYKTDAVLKFFLKHGGLLLSKINFKFERKGLITNSSINEFYKAAKPGDILLTRQNFVATNISIPGFWKHMSMYIGTGKYLKEHFENESLKELSDDCHYIIESTGKGVGIERFEEFIYEKDYLSVFRTTFSEDKTRRAIKEAMRLISKGYDFLFNYHSDNSFVCSELITKSFLKESIDDEGITIKLEKIASGLTYPPNNLVKKVEEDSILPNKEIFPVLFIDSEIRGGKNFIGSNEELLKSYKRSRFSFLLK